MSILRNEIVNLLAFQGRLRQETDHVPETLILSHRIMQIPGKFYLHTGVIFPQILWITLCVRC